MYIIGWEEETFGCRIGKRNSSTIRESCNKKGSCLFNYIKYRHDSEFHSQLLITPTVAK